MKRFSNIANDRFTGLVIVTFYVEDNEDEGTGTIRGEFFGTIPSNVPEKWTFQRNDDGVLSPMRVSVYGLYDFLYVNDGRYVMAVYLEGGEGFSHWVSADHCRTWTLVPENDYLYLPPL